MNLRISGLPLVLDAESGTPISCSHNFEPWMMSKLLGWLRTFWFQSLSRMVAVTEYRPGWFNRKQGARSTRKMTTREDSSSNSPATGISPVLGTT